MPPPSPHRALDVRHLGRERVICCWQVGDALVDPGPSSSLETLLEALGDRVPRRLMLTHIHLDHAGAAGSLVRRFPGLEVWVSERGARHLADPSRLLASAARLYGDQMERLWGEVLPVPEEALRPLAGGERLDGWRVEATPGHASHHVSYLHEDSGWAYVGDTGGVRLDEDALVLPPTPPPDVDLDAWRASLDLIAGWRPEALAITHFGAYHDASAQLERVREGLTRWGDLARRTDAATYAAAIRAAIAAGAPRSALAEAYEQAMPPATLWAGLERHWARVSGG